MRSFQHVTYAALILGGIAIGGCKPSEPAAPVAPTTMTAPETNGPVVTPATMPVPSASQTEVVIPAQTPPAAKDLTHVLTADEPFYLNEPGASPKPIGTLKAGTKVLVLIPGATYSQVLTDKGISCYTMTDGLKPLGK
jgi:hypothetical protein